MVIQLEEIGLTIRCKGENTLDMSQVSFEDIIKMINHQRHDWLNHIQVLHGLLQLNSYEELKQYLDKITVQLQNDHYISQLQNAELILYIHTYSTRNRVMLFEVEITEKIHLDEYNIAMEQIQLLIELIELLSQRSLIENDILPSLVLTMGKLENKVVFTLDYVGHLNAELFIREWNRIREKLLEIGTSIKDHEKNESEWLIEICMG